MSRLTATATLRRSSSRDATSSARVQPDATVRDRPFTRIWNSRTWSTSFTGDPPDPSDPAQATRRRPRRARSTPVFHRAFDGLYDGSGGIPRASRSAALTPGPTIATIDFDALRANFALAVARAGGRTVIAVIKADAYGHGAVGVARALERAGCEMLAVVSVAEAAELREAGVSLPILVLAGVYDARGARDAAALGLTPVVHDPVQSALVAAAAREADRPLPVHVEVDTGMRRMGVPPDEAPGLLELVSREPALVLEGVFTHLARADEPDPQPSFEQLASFRSVLEKARARGVVPGRVHALNSAGLLTGASLLDTEPATSAVRPGLMLYGANPAPHLDAALAPVMTLRSRVVHVRSVAAGEAVGYSALHRPARSTRIATLALGYADGVPISTSNRGHVLLGGARYPIVGRISMDYVTVDVGAAEMPVEIGDEAIVFGAGQGARLTVEEAAEAAGTLAYELLVRVGSRVARVVNDANAD